MKFFVDRHGQTTGDIDNRYGGDYDDSLTAEGDLQSEKLSEQLTREGIEIIYCSPLKRAKQTAQILQKKLECQLQVVNDIRERNNFGILTGMIKEITKEKYPELVEELKDLSNTIDKAATRLGLIFKLSISLTFQSK